MPEVGIAALSCAVRYLSGRPDRYVSRSSATVRLIDSTPNGLGKNSILGWLISLTLLYEEGWPLVANVIFPIERVKELQSEGLFGELAGESYSFVGATSQKRLLRIAPEWADRLKRRTR